jgi:hypothetical protein
MIMTCRWKGGKEGRKGEGIRIAKESDDWAGGE